MENFGAWLIIGFAGYGFGDIIRRVIRYIKLKKGEKPSEIQREVDDILKERNG